MGAKDALKDIYYSMEDKWFNFVDAVSSKAPAFGGFIDTIEEKGVPSFPAAILLVIIIILLLFFFFFSSAQSTLTVVVNDSTGTAVENATITILKGQEIIDSKTTSVTGSYSFLLQNGVYRIKLEKTDYTTETGAEITLAGDRTEDMTLLIEDTTLTKAVYLRSMQGNLITGSGTLTYKCKDDTQEQIATYMNGRFDAKVKSSCDQVEVISVSNYELISQYASFAQDSSVTVRAIELSTGTVMVNLSIKGEAATPSAGLSVRLVPSDGTQPIISISDGTGIIVFNSVPIKTYYIVVSDSQGAFLSYDGSVAGDRKELTQSATIQFNAELIRAVAVKVTITVKDSLAGTLVNGAEVKLTSSTNASEVRTDYTKSTGVVEFTVPQGTEYTVIVDHPAYMVSESISVTAGDTKTIQIEKADPTKANSIIVHVTDPNKMPIDNARVVLKKIDSVDSVVSDKTTGATGEALFVNLELGKSYFAVVSKEGFGSVSSESVQIEPRVQKTLEVTFDIGEGKVILKVLDPEKNPLSGASVKAINQMTSQQEASTVLTSTDGTAEFNIRADKKIYFIVESANYQKYFTTLVNPAANATVNKEIVLYRPSGQLIASIAGIYSGTSVLAGDDAAQISQGVYTVKAIIQVPKGSYTEAGLHLRTGKEVQNVTNNMEEDNVYLSAVNSSGKITKGTSYTPPNGYDIDSKRLTQGDAKWANSVWRNPSEGTYEVESEIVISEADPGVPIELFYRGWAKGASTLRDPKNIATGNELYAMANRRILSSGTSSLCTGSFCRSYTLQTLSGSEAGKKIYVMGTVEAKKGVQYALLADLTNYSGKPISGAVLSVTGKSLDINSVTVNGMVQSAYSSINLGTIGIDAPLKIQVTLSTTSSGTSGIKLAINSSTKNELDETITLNVKQNKKMSFEMVPKVIVPYITNTLFFEAMDNNDPIDGTLVTIKSGKVLLGNVQTTSEGLATYELAEPGIGDVLTITARKEGYDTVELTKAIDTALLTITPDNITETIKKGDVTGFDTTVLIQNNTSTSVKIISTQVTGGLKAYLDVKFDTDPSGAIVERGKDRNYSLSIKLNSAALKLVEPKDVTGNIIFNTTVAGTGQSFLNEVPVDIRISMPGHMDNAKCFKVNPATIDMVASNNEQTKTVTLTNTCAAEGVQIPLQNIEAKLSGELKIGTITLTSTNIKSAVLTDKYAKVSDYLEKEGDEEVTIHFMPNAAVSSGTQTVTILINGKNILDDKTEEKSEAQIKANLTMNILSKCVTIVQPVGGVMLDIAPWSMGYQRIMNSSMAPYTGGYAGFSNQSSPYGLSYMGGMGMTGYGTAGYGNGYNGGLSTYGGYGNAYGAYGAGYGAYGAGSVYSSQLGGATGTVQNMSYDQSSFIIKNTCTGDIDVALEPDPRVVVSEQTFTISADSDKTVVVQPGYVLGRYSIKVNAKPTNTQESKKSLGSVNVTIRRLGDMDPDCIKTNVTNLNLNSFVYRPQTYSVYNTCYDTGVQLSRANVASIECSAPKDQFDLGFYQGRAQSGTGNYYGGQQNNYASGAMMQNACMTNNCSLITGTRIKYRTLEQGATGTTERVDFDVMPSAQYIPQKKLFDNTTGQYGLFQNVSSIRQWATETAARTDVYGTLNVSYSNQYGSGQCQQFPITLTDVWRLTESIDSAINWGDPNARPEECQNKGALDIINYWSVRTGNKDGVVPESEFGLTNKSKYIYIAEPPALRIGPGPTTNTSANYHAGTMGTQTPYTAGYDYTYYSRIAAENASKEKSKTTDKSTTGTKNCGLLDSIKVLTKVTAEEAGGAVITISETGSGTVLKNTRGSNIMVEIDRSAMTVDCVFLSKPITAKVSRAITMDSQDLTWTLNVLFTREGYTYKGGKDKECLKVGTDIDSDC
ncbi:MAG: carboxypeptidase-like regulatory domain-containing protein, partial [Candidatus Diapherotrites archaeon]|nr:carboxypeptidase-like regulatory domain-containing protein [Candidatus Diapherotrites archaeon]